jgi:hypothetical protein
MTSPRVWRVAFGATLVLSALVLAVGYVGGAGYETAGNASVERAMATGADGQVVGPRENVTVVTTDSNVVVGDEGDGPRARAEIVAFAPDGRILYYNDSHTRYWDVDLVAGERLTVEFVAADHLSPDACSSETVCTRNVVERVNLSTGETTRLYDRVTPGKHSTRWHDFDRIDEDRIAVADIHQDRVFVVNTTSELVEWSWEAETDYARSSGGSYPDDWTHVNDVEVLPDGRLMASLRNQDQVVFLDRETGLEASWTLGTDGDYDTLYEQHNPDFLPAEGGRPSVLVADSENRRVVEYVRTGDGWDRTWEWRDSRLQWPRDADRLPNGNTLVTDSNGDRVLEVDRDGEVVWSVDIGFPYEAERLGSGPESAGGPNASAADLQSRTDGEAADGVSVLGSARDLLPAKLVNAVTYVLPGWVGGLEILALVAFVLTALAWPVVEYRRADFGIDLQRPFRVRRE